MSVAVTRTVMRRCEAAYPATGSVMTTSGGSFRDANGRGAASFSPANNRATRPEYSSVRKTGPEDKDNFPHAKQTSPEYLLSFRRTSRRLLPQPNPPFPGEP